MFRLLRWSASFALAVCLLSSGAASAQSGSLEDFCLSKGGVWDAEEAACKATTIIEMNVEYPVELAAQLPAIEYAVDEFVREQREEILALGTDTLYPAGRVMNFYLDISSDVFYHSDTIASLLLTVSNYTGGAHPNSFFKTMTFDLENGIQLGFNQVFPPENNPLAIIAPIAQAQLIEKLPDLEESWIRDGASMDSANYRNFVLTEDSVIFYFDPYQVAPYVYGPQQVEIPLSELEAIMAPLG
ncbi:MAG: DUF3298 domain-containing protein [Chloroflexota bacterium]